MSMTYLGEYNLAIDLWWYVLYTIRAYDKVYSAVRLAMYFDWYLPAGLAMHVTGTYQLDWLYGTYQLD